MTKGQLLRDVGSEFESGSMELTKWFAYFKARHAREEEARKQAEFERQFGPSVSGG